MSEKKIQKTYDEINARIKAGEAVVVTAEEMVDIVRKNGPEGAARKVDVVTTGTFAPMCSSGLFFNFYAYKQFKLFSIFLRNIKIFLQFLF